MMVFPPDGSGCCCCCQAPITPIDITTTLAAFYRTLQSRLAIGMYGFSQSWDVLEPTKRDPSSDAVFL